MVKTINDSAHMRNDNSKIIYILAGILVIASFFIGSLWTKVQVLEKGGTSVAGNQAGTALNPTGTNAGAVQPPAQAAAKKPEITSDDRIRGNKNAKVALIEYSDIECPFCKRFHPTMQQVMKEYGDKVKWVYRDYPLSFHANAQKEAEAGWCIGELGGNDAFWKYIDAIFEQTTSNGTGFALDKLGPLAKEVGVDQTKFQTCLDAGKYAKKVSDQMAAGTAEGVTGTPGTIILAANGDTQLVPGALPFESIKPMIDKALQ